MVYNPIALHLNRICTERITSVELKLLEVLNALLLLLDHVTCIKISSI